MATKVSGIVDERVHGEVSTQSTTARPGPSLGERVHRVNVSLPKGFERNFTPQTVEFLDSPGMQVGTGVVYG